jgi:signal transduction histidine kinase
MLSWVAHEIKSPLSAALMASELALRGVEHEESPGDLKRRLTIIARQLVRMDALVTSILDAARLQEEKLELDVKRFDVSQWAHQVVEYLYIAAALARLHGGELTVESRVNHGSTFTLSIPRRAVAS